MAHLHLSTQMTKPKWLWQLSCNTLQCLSTAVSLETHPPFLFSSFGLGYYHSFKQLSFISILLFSAVSTFQEKPLFFFRIKDIKSIYIDTTFCLPRMKSLPSRVGIMKFSFNWLFVMLEVALFIPNTSVIFIAQLIVYVNVVAGSITIWNSRLSHV